MKPFILAWGADLDSAKSAEDHFHIACLLESIALIVIIVNTI